MRSPREALISPRCGSALRSVLGTLAAVLVVLGLIWTATAASGAEERTAPGSAARGQARAALALAACPAGSTEVATAGELNAAIPAAVGGDVICFTASFSVLASPQVDVPISFVALDGVELTVSAPGGSTALNFVAGSEGSSVDGFTITCEPSAVFTRAVETTGTSTTISDMTVNGCVRGVQSFGSTVAVDSSTFASQTTTVGTGVAIENGSGSTVTGSTFDGDPIGVDVFGATNTSLTGNTISGGGTGIRVDSATATTVSDIAVNDTTESGILVSGATDVTISQLNRSAAGGSASTGITVSDESGPSTGLTIQDSDFANFDVGLLVETGSLSASMTVTGSDFLDEGTAAIVAQAASATLRVVATSDNNFGGCGPRAPDWSYDGGGSLITDSSQRVDFRRDTCTPTPTPTITPTPTATVTPAPTDPPSTSGSATPTDSGSASTSTHTQGPGSAGGDDTGNGALPNAGSPVQPRTLLAGFGLLAAGCACVVGGLRRRPARKH